MSPLYILEKIEGDLTDCGRLGFAAGLPAFGLEESSFFSRSGIPDAKEKAPIGEPGGRVASDRGLDTQHSGTPSQRPHLRPV